MCLDNFHYVLTVGNMHLRNKVISSFGNFTDTLSTAKLVMALSGKNKTETLSPLVVSIFRVVF